jgi:hypothetical protein
VRQLEDDEEARHPALRGPPRRASRDDKKEARPDRQAERNLARDLT